MKKVVDPFKKLDYITFYKNKKVADPNQLLFKVPPKSGNVITLLTDEGIRYAIHDGEYVNRDGIVLPKLFGKNGTQIYITVSVF